MNYRVVSIRHALHEGVAGMLEQPERAAAPSTATAGSGESLNRQVTRIVTIYAVFSALWILVSDRVVEHFVQVEYLTTANTIKGWLFVAVTSTLLFTLVRGLLGQALAATRAAQSASSMQSAAMAALAESEASYRALTEQLPVIIYRAAIDPTSSTTYVSPQVSTLGYTPREWLSDPDLWPSRIHPEDRDRVMAELERTKRTGTNLNCEYRIQTRAGQWLTLRDEAQVVLDGSGRPTHLQGVMLDVTGQRAAEEARDRLANFDSNTGLPNRALLVDRLGQTIALSLRESGQSALILLDVDHLKTVNDALGYQAGDQVLMEIATRLREGVREGDTVARLQGDVFAVLLRGVGRSGTGSALDAGLIAEKLKERARAPIEIAGQPVQVTLSLGVASFPDSDLDEPAAVLSRANTALDDAMAKGGDRTAFFDADMGAAAERRFEALKELRHAITSDELRVFLQPQVDSQLRVVGAEALVRWQHATRGLLLPGTFIPYAEETDLIIELDAWVLSRVCQLLSDPAHRLLPLRIAVNISARHFRQGRFTDLVRATLAETGADPSRLTFEVTESLFIDDLEGAIRQMDELAALGIHFSLDDFGTRYASLSYLKRLPIHELKIDKTFIQDAPTDPNDAVLVQVILSVAEHLHLRVVAEGVETKEQADFLAGRGDVIRQGFLLGRPEPAEGWLDRCARSMRGSGPVLHLGEIATVSVADSPAGG